MAVGRIQPGRLRMRYSIVSGIASLRLRLPGSPEGESETKETYQQNLGNDIVGSFVQEDGLPETRKSIDPMMHAQDDESH